MNLGLPYQILITPDDEGYGVEVPVLRGCVTHAEKWEDIPADDTRSDRGMDRGGIIF